MNLKDMEGFDMKKDWFVSSYNIWAGVSWFSFTISLFLPSIILSKDLFSGIYSGWEGASLTAFTACFLDPGSMLLTGCNLLMLCSPFLLKRVTKNQSFTPAIFMSLAAVSVFTPLLWNEKIQFLEGYYLWCASFIFAAIAFLLAARNSLTHTSTENEEPYQRRY